MTDYYHFIDHDERDEYRAHVEDGNGNVVFAYDYEIFEDGFMRNCEDYRGLAEYLVSLGIAEKGSRVLDGYSNEPPADDDEDDEDYFETGGAEFYGVVDSYEGRD